jgi:hypothetical protein
MFVSFIQFDFDRLKIFKVLFRVLTEFEAVTFSSCLTNGT